MPDPVATDLTGGVVTTATTTASFTAQSTGTLLLLHMAADDYRTTSGANRPESTGWTFLSPGGQSNLGAYMWWKISDGTETSVSYTIGSASRSVYKVTAVTNIDGVSPLGVTATNVGPITASQSSWTTSAITPGAGDRWIVVASVHSTGNATAGPYTWSGSYAKVGTDRYHTTGYRPGVTVSTLVMDGGTSTSATATYSASTIDQGIGIIVAFKNAAGGGGAVTGTLSASVPRLTSSLSGTDVGPTYTGTLSASTIRPTSSISGAVAAPTYTGTTAASVPAVTGSISGTATAPSGSGTLNATTPATTGSIAGTVTPPTYSGTVSASTPRATGSISGTATAPSSSGTLTASLPPTRSTISGTVTNPAGAGTLSGTLPITTGSATGTFTPPTYTGSLNAQLARLTATVTGIASGPAYTGTVVGTLSDLTASISGTVTTPGPATGTIAATLPRLTGSIYDHPAATGNPNPRIAVVAADVRSGDVALDGRTALVPPDTRMEA